jgi:DNA segregation ATPase FtsK/SpoIIIE-like protein
MTDKNCQNILRNLLMTSRNAGVSIIAGTQKPSHKTYADFCESRSQFEARMSFRLSESKDSRLVLGNDKAYEFVKPNQGGRGIWQWGEESIIQSLFIDDDDIDKILNFNNHEFQTRRRKVKNYEKIRQQNFWLLPR